MAVKASCVTLHPWTLRATRWNCSRSFTRKFTDFRREQETVRARLSSLEQHYATMSGDIAQIRIELDDIRSDISLIKRRIDLVEV